MMCRGLLICLMAALSAHELACRHGISMKQRPRLYCRLSLNLGGLRTATGEILAAIASSALNLAFKSFENTKIFFLE